MSFTDAYVTKYLNCDISDTIAKYKELQRLSKLHDFRSPMIHSCDLGQKSITFDRIHGIRSIREVYIDFMTDRVDTLRASRVFEQAGKILALIHRDIRPVVEPKCWSPSRVDEAAFREYGGTLPLQNTSSGVVLHGDFGFANLFLPDRSGDDCQLTVLDPCGDGAVITSDWALGPRELDIARMLLNLEGKLPLRSQHILKAGKVRTLQSSFLTGYESNCESVVDRSACLSFAFMLWKAYVSRSFAFLGPLPLYFLYNSWPRRNYPLHKKLSFMGWANA